MPDGRSGEVTPATGRLAAVAALALGGIGLVYAGGIVGLRAPALPYVAFPRLALWLLLGGCAALTLAVVGLRRGAGRLAAIAVVLVAVVMVIGLVPVVALAGTAADQGATLNPLPALISSRNAGEPATDRSRTYATVDGQALQLDVWPAPGEGPRPAVVWVHGGGWVSGTRGSTPRWNEWFNEQGWSVFDIDYRLAPPARWQQAPGDVRCAVAWVRANAGELGVDPNRVVLAGESAGGHLALVAAYGPAAQFPSSCPSTTADSTPQGVIALYPITDVRRWWEDDTWSGLARVFIGGFVGGDPSVAGAPAASAAEAVSPVMHVRPGLPPTLLLHGERDELVPVEHTRELDRRLGEAGVEHETVLLPFTDHAYDHDWASLPTQVTRGAIADWLAARGPA